MLYKKVEMFIDDFPKLKKEYSNLIKQGYKPDMISLESTPEDEFCSDTLQITLKNSDANTILISQSIYHSLEGTFSDVSIIQLPSKTEKIHPNIKLNRDYIVNKEFKKRLLKGYDCEDVDRFLDIIAEDYKYIEEVLLKELKV